MDMSNEVPGWARLACSAGQRPVRQSGPDCSTHCHADLWLGGLSQGRFECQVPPLHCDINTFKSQTAFGSIF